VLHIHSREEAVEAAKDEVEEPEYLPRREEEAYPQDRQGEAVGPEYLLPQEEAYHQDRRDAEVGPEYPSHREARAVQSDAQGLQALAGAVEWWGGQGLQALAGAVEWWGGQGLQALAGAVEWWGGRDPQALVGTVEWWGGQGLQEEVSRQDRLDVEEEPGWLHFQGEPLAHLGAVAGSESPHRLEASPDHLGAVAGPEYLQHLEESQDHHLDGAVGQ